MEVEVEVGLEVDSIEVDAMLLDGFDSLFDGVGSLMASIVDVRDVTLR